MKKRYVVRSAVDYKHFRPGDFIPDIDRLHIDLDAKVRIISVILPEDYALVPVSNKLGYMINGVEIDRVSISVEDQEFIKRCIDFADFARPLIVIFEVFEIPTLKKENVHGTK